MNIFKSCFFIALMVLFQGVTLAQEWVSHKSPQQINDLVDTGNELLMATDAGLVVMNKTTLEKTIFNKGNSNLTNDHIQSITLAPNGDAYIGTYDVVMGRFDGSGFEGDITPDSDEFDQNTELYDFEIAPNGDVWVATNDGVFHRQGQSWSHYDEDEYGPEFFEAWDIEINTAGEVFVGGRDIHKLSNGVWSNLTDTTQLLGYLDADLFFSASGDLFFAGDLDRIGHFDGSVWKEYDNGGLNGSEIKGITEDTDGAVYFHAMENGVLKLENNTLVPVIDMQTEAFDNRASYFYIDAQNNRWLNHNIYLSVQTNGAIQSTDIAPNTIEYNAIGGIHKGPNGAIYFLMRSSTNSIASVKPDGTWSLLEIPSDLSLWPVLGDLLVLSDDDIWLSSNSGIYHFDGSDWMLIEAIPGTGIALEGTRIAIDSQGKIYIQGIGKVYIIENDVVNEYNVNNSSLSDLFISGIGVDANDNLWIASFDWDGNAAIQKVTTDGTWTTYDNDDHPVIEQPQGAFHFDNEGNVWVPNNFGAIKFDEVAWTNPVEENISVLENYNVSSITNDAEGKLYFSHEYGVSTLLDGEWGNLIIDDVPNITSIHDSEIVFDNAGTLWWANSRYGVFSYTPESTTSTFTEIAENIDLSIYPNPAHDYCVVDFKTEEYATVEISVYNNLGQLVSSTDFGQLPEGAYQETINLNNLSKGLYTLQLKTNNKMVSKKIIVQ